MPIPRQVTCRIDQPHMGERLGKIAQKPSSMGIVLFRQQANVVLQGNKPLEKLHGFLAASEQHETIDQPKRTNQKDAFTGRQSIDVRFRRIAMDEAVVHQFPLDGFDGADDSRILGGQKATKGIINKLASKS